MKTKEELLQSVYGAEYIHADINGWMKYGMYHPSEFEFDKDEVDRYGDMDLWRPKTLNGIDDNFGWISINSENDLPSEQTECWILDKEKGLICGNFLNNSKEEKKYWVANASHYQPIVKPNKPLHK